MRFGSPGPSELFSQIHHRNTVGARDFMRGLRFRSSLIRPKTCRPAANTRRKLLIARKKKPLDPGYNRNALTEIAWEDAEQGLGLAINVYHVTWQLFIATCFTNGDISGCVFSLVFQRADLLKIGNFNPQQKARFCYGKN